MCSPARSSMHFSYSRPEHTSQARFQPFRHVRSHPFSGRRRGRVRREPRRLLARVSLRRRVCVIYARTHADSFRLSEVKEKRQVLGVMTFRGDRRRWRENEAEPGSTAFFSGSTATALQLVFLLRCRCPTPAQSAQRHLLLSAARAARTPSTVFAQLCCRCQSLDSTPDAERRLSTHSMACA
jgi:hypothetical protein